MNVNVPAADQRTEKGADGRPPEDGNMDCVAESLAKMAQALTGRYLTGDGLHDAVYGEGYVGMQDPARYVSYLASLGLTLTPYTGAPAALIAHAVACIQAGHPVLLSIPSDWGDEPPHSQYAHMVAGCDVSADANTLTAMNPWGGFYQTESLAWWQERLAHCAYSPMWVMTREGEKMSVPNGWHDDGTTLTAPNGAKVIHGFRDHILAAPSWNPALVPLASEFAASPGVCQEFALRLEWSAANNTVAEAPGQSPPSPSDPTSAPLRAALNAFLKA